MEPEDNSDDKPANYQRTPCGCVYDLEKGYTSLLKRTSQQDDCRHLLNGKLCGEAWDAISRCVYTGLRGGSTMKG